MAAETERIIGGPGTGKTHNILGRLTEAKKRLGLSHHEIGLCTFTRAGRQEMSERAAAEWGVTAESLTKGGWFRTAHSISHRQCQVESGALLQGEEGADFLGRAVGGRVAAKYRADTQETMFISADGDPTVDVSLRAWDLCRSRMVPLRKVLSELERLAGEYVPALESAANVIEKYERAKNRDSRLDFTDMVARFAGVRFSIDGPTLCEPEGEVPEEIRVLAIDEAQDSSALVDRVCRRLASSPRMEMVFLTGDTYQSIYRFGGSDYRHFLSWDAAESIMPQSYRCPPEVMELGERCIRQMRTGYRERNIRPASHRGSIKRLSSADEAIDRLNPAESTLILGRCGFSLDSYEEALRRKRIPYSWLDKSGGSAALAGYQCLWAMQHGEVVSNREWTAAVSILSVSSRKHGKILSHGEKTAWKEGRRAEIDFVHPSPEYVTMAGGTDALVSLIASGQWQDAVEPKRSDEAELWIASARRWGPEVASNPRVKLSTIHAAKGCEGDTVILSTISSAAVTNAAESLSEAHDEECRVNYVAVTRARRNLWVVDDAGKHSLELPV
jgi:superfamily I DNA/RNA helicase